MCSPTPGAGVAARSPSARRAPGGPAPAPCRPSAVRSSRQKPRSASCGLSSMSSTVETGTSSSRRSRAAARRSALVRVGQERRRSCRPGAGGRCWAATPPRTARRWLPVRRGQVLVDGVLLLHVGEEAVEERLVDLVEGHGQRHEPVGHRPHEGEGDAAHHEAAAAALEPLVADPLGLQGEERRQVLGPLGRHLDPLALARAAGLGQGDQRAARRLGAGVRPGGDGGGAQRRPVERPGQVDRCRRRPARSGRWRRSRPWDRASRTG